MFLIEERKSSFLLYTSGNSEYKVLKTFFFRTHFSLKPLSFSSSCFLPFPFPFQYILYSSRIHSHSCNNSWKSCLFDYTSRSAGRKFTRLASKVLLLTNIHVFKTSSENSTLQLFQWNKLKQDIDWHLWKFNQVVRYAFRPGPGNYWYNFRLKNRTVSESSLHLCFQCSRVGFNLFQKISFVSLHLLQQLVSSLIDWELVGYWLGIHRHSLQTPTFKIRDRIWRIK